MWYRKQLHLIRRARRRARAQQQLLFALEIEGLTAITLHAHGRQLTIAIERPAGAQIVDTLRDTLRDHRRTLKAEAHQLRHDWHESEALKASRPPASQQQPAPGDEQRS